MMKYPKPLDAPYISAMTSINIAVGSCTFRPVTIVGYRYGSSTRKIIVGVDNKDFAGAIRVLYDSFVK